MSKTLRKILKILILPASLLIISKALGIYFASILFNLQFFLETQQTSFFSVQIFFLDSRSTLAANSFSNIFTLAVFTIITSYLILKYWLAITSKYNPRTLVKLSNLNLISWIQEKDNTFLKVFVWTIFIWITSIFTINDTLKQTTYEWIGIVAFIVVICSTWILIRTLETELENIYPNNDSKLF